MKPLSLSIAGNILLAFGIAILFFKLYSSHTEALTVSGQSCYSCTNDPFHGLTVGDFMYDVARYHNTHSGPINLTLKNVGMATMPQDSDARSCWYPLDTLKQFICLVEKYSGALGIAHSQLGIRFYYATYPQNLASQAEKVDPFYRYHHTIFLVPTRADSDYNVDFDPRASTAPIAPRLAPPYDSASIMALDLGNGNVFLMAKNQSRLCPPYCPTPDVLASIDAALGYSVAYTTDNQVIPPSTGAPNPRR